MKSSRRIKVNRIKIIGSAAALLLAGGLSVGLSSPASAQAAPFLDTPTNHWAYEAVQDLAKKGIVIGYPDGTYGGKRPMTRYEFAVAIDRMLRTLADMNSQNPPPGTPAPSTLNQDELNQVQALIDKFRPELDTIQTNLQTAQDNIDALRADVLDAKALAAKAQDTANNSYGVGADRKFQISGYLQARFQSADGYGKGSLDRFPQGVSSKAGSYNGNYAQGGNVDSVELRRARLKFTGALTANTRYAVQIDTSGAVTAGASPNQQVTVREGYVAYTLGDGNAAKNLTITAGQFANPFGYALPVSMSNFLTPERPLAFSEGNYGLFNSQDYDKGLQIGYNTQQQLLFLPAGLKFTVAAVNGAGRTGEDSDRTLDTIYRIAYQSPNKVLSLGTSYYLGQINDPDTGVAATSLLNNTGSRYTGARKQLLGFDGQLAVPTGQNQVFLNGEYVGGLYEERTFFTGAANSLTNGSALQTVYAQDNRVDGYYVQGGYTFGATGNHGLTLAANYDVLKRGEGKANAFNTGGSSAYKDENFGYGALYNLDKATRLRFWYIRPTTIAHQPGFASPPKYGLFTGELQVKF